jgi:hypothetical protein
MRQLTLFEAFAVERPPDAAIATTTTTTTVCYVCHEPTTEKCQCACRAVVHADCLLRSVRASGKANCTICLGPIANLRVRTWRRVSRRLTCGIFAMGTIVMVCCLAAGLLVGLAAEEKRPNVFCDLLICCAVSVGASMAASRVLHRLLCERDLATEHTEYVYG